MEFKTKKSLGQNFLVDNSVLKKIVEVSGIDADSEVLEVGPGSGNLTDHILKKKNQKKFTLLKKIIIYLNI